jgi:hypothetical protein
LDVHAGRLPPVGLLSHAVVVVSADGWLVGSGQLGHRVSDLPFGFLTGICLPHMSAMPMTAAHVDACSSEREAAVWKS